MQEVIGALRNDPVMTTEQIREIGQPGFILVVKIPTVAHLITVFQTHYNMPVLEDIIAPASSGQHVPSRIHGTELSKVSCKLQ